MSFDSPVLGLKTVPLQFTKADVAPNVSGTGKPAAAGLVIDAGSENVKLSDAPGSASHVHWAKFELDVDTAPALRVTLPYAMPPSFTQLKNGVIVSVIGAPTDLEVCALTVALAHATNTASMRISLRN